MGSSFGIPFEWQQIEGAASDLMINVFSACSDAPTETYETIERYISPILKQLEYLKWLNTGDMAGGDRTFPGWWSNEYYLGHTRAPMTDDEFYALRGAWQGALMVGEFALASCLEVWMRRYATENGIVVPPAECYTDLKEETKGVDSEN